MISNQKQVLLCLLILFSAFSADARSVYNRSYKKYQNVKHQTPLLRQLDYDTITGTADDADNDADGYGTGTGTGTATDVAPDADVVDVSPTDAMVLLKPTQTTENGRLFGGFFIRALFRGGGGGFGGGNIPYIVVNATNNITNVNQNSLNNTASTTATTTTTTAAPGTRQQVFYQSFPQSSEYFQRRGSNPLDMAHNFMLSPGNQLIPIYLPPEVESLIQGNFNRPSVVQRRRGNNQPNLYPFSPFANNFKRVQYL